MNCSAADLMVKGLANGIVSSPTSMCDFGKLSNLPAQQRSYIVRLQRSHYALMGGGKAIRSTRQATS